MDSGVFKEVAKGFQMSSKANLGMSKSKNIDNDVSVSISNLGKSYQIYDRPEDRLKQAILPKLQRGFGRPASQYFRDFWALKDISFDVKKGEVIGIVGRNGSGKSTLLQMICGTLTPSRGYIHTQGRVAALLELGSGFNPEFTGRENVYLNAAILGLSKEETSDRFNDIASFADIGEFINQPVKTYSSGMLVRLAFAVQSQVDPDILVVDEALAVGDAKFQAKCFERLRQLKEKGTSILLVTHSNEQIITHCSKAILLDKGIQLNAGDPNFVINCYNDLLFGKPMSLEALPEDAQCTISEKSPKNSLSIKEDVFNTHIGYNPHEYRWGDGAASILDFFLATDNTSYPASVKTGQNIRLSATVKFHSNFYRPIFSFRLKTKEGITVYGTNSDILKCSEFHDFGKDGTVIQIDIEFTCRLCPGDYFISIGIVTKEGEEVIPHDRRYDSIHLHVSPATNMFGLADLELTMLASEIMK